MIDEEDVGLLVEGRGGEYQATLAAAGAVLDGEKVAAVECLGGELAKEVAVEVRGDAGDGEGDHVYGGEVVEGQGGGSHGGGRESCGSCEGF